jgi:hypothetical protein
MAFARRLRVAGAMAVAGTVTGMLGVVVWDGPASPFFNDLLALDRARLRDIATWSFVLFVVAFAMLSFGLSPWLEPDGHDDRHPHLDSPEPRK